VLVRHVADLREQEVEVGVVVAVPARPAGAEHARHPAQRVHRQAGVVRDGGQAGVPDPLAGLQQRVLREREPGLRHLLVRRHVVQPDQFGRRAAQGGVQDAL
jgi:hypothetical protein